MSEEKQMGEISEPAEKPVSDRLKNSIYGKQHDSYVTVLLNPEHLCIRFRAFRLVLLIFKQLNICLK